MPDNTPPARQKSLRLRGYDYSLAGGYFLTIVLEDRAGLLAVIENEAVRLLPAGRMVEYAWYDLPNHYHHVILDALVIMPNHIHGIIFLSEMNGEIFPRKAHEDLTRPLHGLTEIVRAFKTFSAQRINELTGTKGCKVWQRGYHEHIIRNDEDLHRIRAYIDANPANWEKDENYPG